MESLDNIAKDIKTTENFETQTEIRNQKFQIVNQIGIIYIWHFNYVYID